ncbi:hypothetical protein D3C77_713430 [compost metagenome]
MLRGWSIVGCSCAKLWPTAVVKIKCILLGAASFVIIVLLVDFLPVIVIKLANVSVPIFSPSEVCGYSAVTRMLNILSILPLGFSRVVSIRR